MKDKTLKLLKDYVKKVSDHNKIKSLCSQKKKNYRVKKASHKLGDICKTYNQQKMFPKHKKNSFEKGKQLSGKMGNR